MRLELDLDFAKRFAADPQAGDRFVFGVANAPYLSEGGYNGDGQPQNIYALPERTGAMERSGEATRFWTDYERQVGLAASLGLDVFRTGIEWSRVQPSVSFEKTDPPAWDEAAVERYAEIVAAILGHGMTPIVTLHHFTHPAWCGVDFWQEDEGPSRLVDYMVRVTDEVSSRLVRRGMAPLSRFVLFNEVNLVPLIYHWGELFPSEHKGPEAIAAAFDRILATYVSAYDALKDLYERRGWPEPELGFGVASQGAYEIDKMAYDLVRLRQHGVARADAGAALAGYKASWTARIEPLARSKLTPSQREAWESQRAMCGMIDPSGFTRTLNALYESPRARKLDYLSANVYEPFVAARAAGTDQDVIDWWDYTADPDVYGAFTRAYHDHNPVRAEGGLPVIMGENGLMHRRPLGQAAEPRPDGWTRERYLKSYLMEVVRMMGEGVPIEGYLFWSITDDFEWQDGYAPRCGLYGYDYARHEIEETDGLGEPSGAIYAYLIRALRSGDPAVIADAFTKRYGEGPDV